MGDRFVVGFKDKSQSETMYLYSHWGGEEQKKIIASALENAQGRWQDSHYATRICVSQIIGDEWRGSLGFGLSVGNFAYPDYDTIFVVDWQSQTVNECDTENPKIVVNSHSFGAFILANTLTKSQFDKFA